EIVGEKYGIQTNIVKQSPEISQGVDTGGAGDQGIMVGYACRENEDMIPMELYLARDLAKLIYNTYSKDGKTQITINENGEIVCVVASFCDAPSDILKDFINLWLYQKNTIEKVDVFCNPAGDWSQGGFDADTGLTGRKLAVDNYGPQIPIGGGAFSGKDASKVDRSGAYMARKIAVDYLKKFSDASEVIVKLAYSIGIAEPVMATALVKKGEKWFEIEVKGYDLTPKGIIKFLKLKNPIYQKTAEWGHMGNGFIWDN
ncbi:methionine adenosyltransferase domain-containing protein, partial [Methanoculleus sp.]|uniref:methionine adenosyltransferase domain-containing protein n=1 Tax=Methanoculleus sp. TaxID=90427 RepID=UPI0025FF0182